MPTFAFVANRHNLNSIAALTGTLETDPRTAAFRLCFLWQDGRLMQRLRELAGESDALIAALSFATAGLADARRLLSELRAQQCPPYLIAGGPHPSARPEDVLRLGADIVVIGEGEATLPSILERLAEGGSPAGLPGTAALASDGQLVKGPRSHPVHLDDYPPLGVAHRRFGPIEITRGCPSGCGFCQTTFLFGGRMRHRSVESVVYWLKKAMRRGYRYVRFVTPNALAYQSADTGQTANLDAIEDLLTQVGSLVGKEQVYFGTFPSEVGPELVTPEAVALIRRTCGNDNLIVGAQTGSDRLLRALHRRHSVADVVAAVETISACGLTPIADFIFGLPGEEPGDLADSVRLVEDLVAKGAVIHAHAFMPLPGTPLAGAPPGRVEPSLHPLLDRLASQGRQIGKWRKQQEIARSWP